ncbi:hypothetical protein U8Q05_37015 (plasmid) [Rhizobium ruizarguesonis]|nr:hypothetical protein U8Q05_37015 [Rhizobium ruizarguesonis]
MGLLNIIRRMAGMLAFLRKVDDLRSGKITECGQADGYNEYVFESVKQSSLALSANYP